MALPLLILHGTADKAAKVGGSKFFYETAGSADKTLKLYEESYHDPLNDLDKQLVINDIQNWIASRFAQRKTTPTLPELNHRPAADTSTHSHQGDQCEI